MIRPSLSYWGESSHSLDTSPQVSTMWHRHKLSVVRKVCEYTHLYKESYVSWLILSGQYGPETRVTMYRCQPDSFPRVPGPEGSILLIKSILCSRTYSNSTDPSINTQQSGLWVPSTLLPALPTFSPVTLIRSPQTRRSHHSYHRCTLYILYFLPGISFLLRLTILERSHIVYR